MADYAKKIKGFPSTEKYINIYSQGYLVEEINFRILRVKKERNRYFVRNDLLL